MNRDVYEVDVDNDIPLEQLHKQVCEKFGYTNARLIYAGRIMNLADNLSNYIKETDRGFIVVMKINNPNTTNTTSQTNTSSTQAQINPILNPTIPILNPTIPTLNPTIPTLNPTIPTLNSTLNSTTSMPSNLYTIRQVRGAIIGALRYISSNQILNYTFFTSPNDFYQLMRSDEFADTIQQILDNADEIAEVVDNNQNMQIELETNRETMNVNRETNRETMNVNRETNRETMNVNRETNRVNELTDQDRVNIQTLVGFGYSEQQAIFAYFMAQKDLNLAASLLLDL